MPLRRGHPSATNIGSAAFVVVYLPNLPLFYSSSPVPPGARAVRGSHVSYCRRQCTPPSSNHNHRIRLPAVSSSFSAARFQSRSLTRLWLSSDYRLLDPVIKATACTVLPRCVLLGRNFMLKLYSDLPRLPLAVPNPPDFSSGPCRISAASAAHTRGACLTLTSRPSQGFPPLRQ